MSKKVLLLVLSIGGEVVWYDRPVPHTLSYALAHRVIQSCWSAICGVLVVHAASNSTSTLGFTVLSDIVAFAREPELATRKSEREDRVRDRERKRERERAREREREQKSKGGASRRPCKTRVFHVEDFGIGFRRHVDTNLCHAPLDLLCFRKGKKHCSSSSGSCSSEELSSATSSSPEEDGGSVILFS